MRPAETNPNSADVFDRIYLAHCEDVHRLAWYLARHRQDAEDLFQEVWLRAARRAEDLTGITDPKKWLVAITVNCHRDGLRRKRLRRLFLAGPREGRPGEDQSAEEPADVPARLDLARAIAGLPPRQKEIFVLKELEGFKIREIAVMLHIHQGTVKSMLHAAVRRLRHSLSEEGSTNSRWRAGS